MSTSCSNARTTLRMVEFQLENVFLVIFILNMDVKPNVVEFFILGQSKARMARMARQRMVGSAITRTTPESCTEKYKESCMETSERERSQLLSGSPESGFHSQSCARLNFLSFLAVSRPDSSDCHESDGRAYR